MMRNIIDVLIIGKTRSQSSKKIDILYRIHSIMMWGIRMKNELQSGIHDTTGKGYECYGPNLKDGSTDHNVVTMQIQLMSLSVWKKVQNP